MWELLSDGSFSNAFEEQFRLRMLLYDLLWDQDNERDEDDDDDDEGKSKKEKKFKTYLWNAQRFKKG